MKGIPGSLQAKAVGKGMRKGSTFVPSKKDFARLGKLATFHLEAMGRNFAEWSKVMKSQLGDWVVPHLQKTWSAVSLYRTKQMRNIIETQE